MPLNHTYGASYVNVITIKDLQAGIEDVCLALYLNKTDLEPVMIHKLGVLVVKGDDLTIDYIRVHDVTRDKILQICDNGAYVRIFDGDCLVETIDWIHIHDGWIMEEEICQI